MRDEAGSVLLQVVLVDEQWDLFVEVVENAFGVEPVGLGYGAVVGVLCDIGVVCQYELLDGPELALLLRPPVPVPRA